MSWYKKSFEARLITLAVLPVVMVALVLSIVVGNKMKSTMTDETLSELKSTAYAFRTCLNSLNGEFGLDENEEMTCGGRSLSYMNEMLDQYTANSGLYVTVFFGDTRRITSVKNDGKRAIGTQAVEAVITKVLKGGGEYESLSTTVAGKNCVVAYVPLYQPDGKTICGMVFTGIDRSNYDKTISSAIMMVAMVAILGSAIVIAIAVFVSMKMNRAISGSTRVVTDLAEGDFTKESTEAGKDRADALGTLVRNVNELKEKFSDAISGVKTNIEALVDSSDGLDKAANEAADSMGDLSNAVEEIANGATTQAQEVETSAQGVSDILRTMESINDSVAKTNECTENMEKNSKQVVGDFETLISDTFKSIEKLKDITSKMSHVQEAVETVTTAANDINNIASQTNLLSLNASIEAARAGEAGRGFAVVAGEISALADQSNQAAVKIRDIMSNLKDETEGAVSMVSDMAAMMDKQDETSKKSQASLQELIGAIDQTKDMVGDVKRNSDAVSKLCATLNDSISSLSAISEENAASAQETSASIQQMSQVTKDVQDMSNELKTVAGRLEDITAYFKVQ
ncbi:MAG: methyl-accepting chemotaxis protein [Lachnospiraceae bacterium]|nr:methyl-accepting chemotaxis protein [Lachnospiraceae bacterium]